MSHRASLTCRFISLATALHALIQRSPDMTAYSYRLDHQIAGKQLEKRRNQARHIRNGR